MRGRLEAEALAAKKINHINIPRLYEFGFEKDQFVYVTGDTSTVSRLRRG